MLRLVCMSDTHGGHRRLKNIPEGDVLIHAGDFSEPNWTTDQIREFASWLGDQPHRHKILVAGNHDRWVERAGRAATSNLMAEYGVHYLEDCSTTLEGVEFYGSPWTPWFYDWAFNFPRWSPDADYRARETWGKIPGSTDVLITHGPPYLTRDTARDGRSTGCRHLRYRIQEIRPQVHVFGHIHEAYGRAWFDGTTWLNCSVADRANHVRTKQPPMAVEVKARRAADMTSLG